MEYINGFEKEIIFDQEVKNVELQIKHKQLSLVYFSKAT